MFSNENPLALREELRRISRIMGNSGINTEFKGSGGATDGKNIFLPALPLDVKLSNVEQSVYRGYHIHEVAHIRHTDMELWQSTNCSERLRNIWNCFEDAVIERKSIPEYPSLLRHISNVMDVVIGRNNEDISKHGRSPEWWTETHYAALQMQRRMMGNRSPELQTYLDGLPSELAQEARSWADVINGCDSTKSTLEAARRLCEWMDKKDDENKQNKQDDQALEADTDGNQSADGETGREAEDGNSGAGSRDNEIGDGKDASNDCGDPSSQRDDKVDGGGENNGNDGDDGGDVSAKRAEDDVQSDRGSDDGSGPTKQADRCDDQDQADSGQGKASEDALAWTPASDEMLQEAQRISRAHNPTGRDDGRLSISKQSESLEEWLDKGEFYAGTPKRNGGVPYQMHGKKYRDYAANRTKLNRLRKKIAKETVIGASQISQIMRMSRLFLAREERRKLSGLTEGRVDSKRLSSLIAGRTDIFRKTQVLRTKRTIVSVVMDASSSMIAEDTCKLAMMLNELLQRSGIDYEFSAWSREGNVILKQVHDRKDVAREKIAGYKIFHGTDTPMAAAFNTAAYRISQQQYARRVMLFVSDMETRDVPHEHVRRVSRALEAEGVEVIGIGFGGQANYARDMFTHKLMYLTAKDAQDRMIKHLGDMLMSMELDHAAA
jgi:hypothetical protein